MTTFASASSWFKGILAIDGYKTGHIRQYPVGAEFVYSNFTPRSVKNAPSVKGCDDKIVFFGLQYILKSLLIENFNRTFFARPEDDVAREYQRVMDAYLGKGAVDTDHIRALHRLGYLPVTISAIPEGESVNAKVPMLTIHNTHADFAWVPGYLETALSSHLWMPCTTATIARKYRTILDRFARLTGVPDGFTQFQGHDFSFRGMHPGEAPAVSGAGHLLSFVGTDTIPSLLFLEEFYGANLDNEFVGCSVPATEHSVMCMSGQDGEDGLFLRLITQVYPEGIVSIVSDTWDFWKVITELLPRFKDTILARNGKLVIRPDSSPKTPLEIICGDPEAEPGTPEYKGAIECMWETFGGTLTEKGFKVLDPHIGLIYGDSITLSLAENILKRLAEKGFASNNVVLGIGSYTYAYNTRDTYGFAMKATAGTIAGKDVEIYKDPKTDKGLKASARGYLQVVRDEAGDYIMKDRVSKDDAAFRSELKEVFRDGKIIVDHKLSEIRERVLRSIPKA